MKAKRLKAFTLMEVLTVAVIITILVGILMPALSQVKKLAKETKEKAQIGSIEIAINLYKNDFGEYPPSHGCYFSGGKCAPDDDPVDALKNYNYCGAQTLAESMLGQDLLGFHPASIYRAEGQDASNNKLYDFTGLSEDDIKKNLNKRKDPYLDRTNISVFTPGQIFGKDTSALFCIVESSKYVICDVFTAVSRTITLPDGSTKSYKIGTPVLYFRANPSSLNTELMPSLGGDPVELVKNIYNWRDNYCLMSLELGRVADGKAHPLWTISGDKFYDFIKDPMIPTSIPGSCGRPVRPDSFLLISAGNDGLYGTRDDICNFEPNFE